MYQYSTYQSYIIQFMINSKQKYKQNNMAKTKTTKANIARFSIRRRIHTNPQAHQEPLISYFSKVGRDNSLLNGDYPRIKSKFSDLTNDNIERKKMTQSKLNPFNSTSQSFQLKTNKSLSCKKSRLENTVQEAAENSNKVNNFNPPSSILEQETKRRQYLSYTEYQNLLQDGKILPNYFQKIAKKNDTKTKHSQSQNISKKSTKKINKSKQKLSSASMKIEMIQGIEAINQKIKIKLNPQSSLQQIKPVQTIISSNLGMLSNHQIRQKLQEKWEKQSKYHTINKLIMTEESQLASDKDTRRVSIKDESNFWSLKKKVKKQPENEENVRYGDLNKIQSEQQKEKLLRIFSKKQRQALEQQNISRGEEYELFQQNMFRVSNQYKQKKFVLKHKVQWKV